MKITKSKEWYRRAHWIFYVSAWVACILPTLVAGIANLPLIATKNAESTLSGSFTVCLVMCIYPIYKGLVTLFKSPSAPVIMWILFILSFLLHKLAESALFAMVIVFGVAAVGNTIGAILFFVAKIFKQKYMFFDGGEV